MVKAVVWVALAIGAFLLLLLVLKVSFAVIVWLLTHLLPLAFGFALGWLIGRAERRAST